MRPVAEVHPAGGGLPEGQTFHAAGASEGGWTIIAVRDSKDGSGRGSAYERLFQMLCSRALRVGSTCHLKRRDSRFTTCSPEPDL